VALERNDLIYYILRARAPPEEEEQVTGDENSSYKVTFLHTGQLSMFGSDRL